MASYQIPQFLDSGEKIFGPMNLRQFGYALGGFMLCAAIFTIITSIIPGIGYYGLLFVVPIALLAAYLALGKYNGRDSEVYVYKLFLFILKPKNMVYQRQPDLEDLNKKQSEWNFDGISRRWSSGFAKEKDLKANNLSQFGKNQIQDKATLFRNIGENIDTSSNNTFTEVAKQELNVASKEATLKQVLELKRQQKQAKKKR